MPTDAGGAGGAGREGGVRLAARFGRKYDIIHMLSPKLIRSKKSCRRAIGNDADLIAVRKALGNRRKSEAFEGRGQWAEGIAEGRATVLKA